MLFLKSCPRCTGDINADSDTHGTFLSAFNADFRRIYRQKWRPYYLGRRPPLRVRRRYNLVPVPLRHRLAA